MARPKEEKKKDTKEYLISENVHVIYKLLNFTYNMILILYIYLQAKF